MDLLNEGENECALIAGFVRDRLHDEPGADVAYLNARPGTTSHVDRPDVAVR